MIIQVSVNTAYTGYVLAEDVYAESGKLLLAKGTRLTENKIIGLLRYRVKKIYVYEKIAI
jgi:molybdopterin biosynthesis enzyme